MVKKISSELELQNECILKMCADLGDFLVKKNTSYDGSVFREVTYGGKVIDPIDTINIRITDKIRRLQSTDPNFNGEDAEKDLCCYIILKNTVAIYNKQVAEATKEEKKRQQSERIKEIINNPEVKQRRRRGVNAADQPPSFIEECSLNPSLPEPEENSSPWVRPTGIEKTDAEKEVEKIKKIIDKMRADEKGLVDVEKVREIVNSSEVKGARRAKEALGITPLDRAPVCGCNPGSKMSDSEVDKQLLEEVDKTVNACDALRATEVSETEKNFREINEPEVLLSKPQKSAIQEKVDAITNGLRAQQAKLREEKAKAAADNLAENDKVAEETVKKDEPEL